MKKFVCKIIQKRVSDKKCESKSNVTVLYGKFLLWGWKSHSFFCVFSGLLVKWWIWDGWEDHKWQNLFQRFMNEIRYKKIIYGGLDELWPVQVSIRPCVCISLRNIFKGTCDNKKRSVWMAGWKRLEMLLVCFVEINYNAWIFFKWVRRLFTKRFFVYVGPLLHKKIMCGAAELIKLTRKNCSFLGEKYAFRSFKIWSKFCDFPSLTSWVNWQHFFCKGGPLNKKKRFLKEAISSDKMKRLK